MVNFDGIAINVQADPESKNTKETLGEVRDLKADANQGRTPVILAALEEKATRLETDIASLALKVAALESDKTSLLEVVASLEAEKSSLKDANASLESDKTSLE